jgi:hypothetical protein
MSSTFTTTFTRTHAKHLAAKVVADLYQCHIHYGFPSEQRVKDYESELVEMLINGYVTEYEFGFKQNNKRILTWAYTVGPDGGLVGDSEPGRIYARAAVAGATYFNFLTSSQKWADLPAAAKNAFENTLPFQRSAGSLPVDGDGYWVVDHGYSAGGIRIERKTFRPR